LLIKQTKFERDLKGGAFSNLILPVN